MNIKKQTEILTAQAAAIKSLTEELVSELSELLTSDDLYELYCDNCRKRGWPSFASKICYHCNTDLMQAHKDLIIGGRADITGCPCCHRSFVD